MIQLGEQLADGLVQFFQGKELAMPQRRDDPTLGYFTAFSTLALSRGLYGRAGTMPKPQCCAKL